MTFSTHKQEWQQINCYCHRAFQDEISQCMETANALSITFQDAGDTPVLEPLPGETPLWDDLILTALFGGDDDLSTLLLSLEHNKQQWKISHIDLERIEDQDWERAWMDDFKPMKFGENLWIYPSWNELPEDHSTKIILDPGLAFGSGTHPTTALCLEWLDANPPHGLSVIDYGCGSGILAIAAAKLGAGVIIATDIDHQALIATNDNRLKNQIPESAIETYFPEDMPTEPVELLIANILSGPLVALAETFAQLTKPNGTIVLSGILKEQTKHIVTAYQAYFSGIQVTQKGDWIRVTAQRNQ
ncbi:MAG TPA: 50S ribosomal protein L11 methyltransferase [Leucothrix mucor]|uniref:Ribosomal protein L11 methyltransferase n=1 Tax=Leucothrix mucor TaxID=45248 RepID=A0A7V2SY52_LEUMU|nr:50S ribosomal protein L11 methyltransferase [Leucothrix mucor]